MNNHSNIPAEALYPNHLATHSETESPPVHRAEVPASESHWSQPQSLHAQECCPHQLSKPNPHPSQTQPPVHCGNYYPHYCESMSRPTQISCGTEEQGLMVHLNKNGGIQVAKGKQSKDFSWNRLPPLHQPISNNCTNFVRTQVWDPRYAQQSLPPSQGQHQG